MQVSSSDTCERTVLFTVSIFANGQIGEECVLRTVVADKAGVYQTPPTLCEENSLVADAAVLRLPGILSLPGITLPFNVLPGLLYN